MSSPRLFVDADLSANARVALAADQTHYLVNVMRLGVGAPVRVFNGRDGEWEAVLTEAGKKAATLAVSARRREQTAAPDVHLLFAPLKKTRTDFVVEKATELGVAALRPVFTERTDAARVNAERLAALAREAAEQSERLDLPEVRAPEKLDRVLGAWSKTDARRTLVYCDEGAAAG
ncbi:MAG: 16S rRNA (uracil(1498)-N(3))-methyltransferase, partial [Caulobacterales bacterium]|nr:16S rRNA (uracil(1498)-N(3))-methyltransferase [Caulobacterales bacterium]